MTYCGDSWCNGGSEKLKRILSSVSSPDLPEIAFGMLRACSFVLRFLRMISDNNWCSDQLDALSKV